MLSIFSAHTAIAQELRPEPTPGVENSDVAAARTHFDRGLALARAGDLDAAIDEFEAAARIEVSANVLVNLGEAYAAAGRPVEATRALRRYLELADDRGEATRRARAASIIEVTSKRIAYLQIFPPPWLAELWVDGHRIELSNRGNPLQIASGSRALVAVGADGRIGFQRVQAPPGSVLKIAQDSPLFSGFSLNGAAVVEVRCRVPDARMAVDGTPTPFPASRPLVLMPGKHGFAFSRAGYRSTFIEMDVTSEFPASVDCALAPQSTIPANVRSTLRVEPSVEDAEVWLDGAPVTGPFVPSGPHRLEVRRSGFQVWKGEVTLTPGQILTLPVTLVRTAEARDRRARRNTWATIAIGSGATLLSSAGILWLASREKAEDWTSASGVLVERRDDLSRQELMERQHSLQAVALSAQRFENIALGAAAVGGSLVAFGFYVLFEGSTVAGLTVTRGSGEVPTLGATF